VNLNNAKLNELYIVEMIDKDDKDAMKKLLSMGILPGIEIKVMQKKPVIVFEVYNSRFAIDEYLGEKIYVKESNPHRENT
jgi:Fe2+ transport system protein FeoA